VAHDFPVCCVLQVTIDILDAIPAAVVVGDGAFVQDAVEAYRDFCTHRVAASSFGHPWNCCSIGEHPWRCCGAGAQCGGSVGGKRREEG